MRLQLHMYTQEGPSHLLLKYDEQFEDCLGILYGFINFTLLSQIIYIQQVLDSNGPHFAQSLQALN